MATWYYDFSQGVNGTGTTVSPFNTFPGATISAGDSHLFKRGNSATFAFVLSSGAGSLVTRYGAWANSDGTDNSALAQPVIVTNAVMSTLATAKGNLRIENLTINATGIAVADDKALMFLSNSATVAYCNINSNIGGIGIWGASNVTIQNNTLQAVSHSSANNNNCLIVSGTTAMDNIAITNNIFLHEGGGGTGSHAVRLECTSSANGLTHLTFQNNVISTVTSASNANVAVIAVRIQRAPGATVSFNTMRYHLEGLFMLGGGTATSATVAWNTAEYNRHFGLHFTTDVNNCLIEHNTCRFNGTSTNDAVSLFAYGRGLEFSSGAGQGRCAGHTIRYNTCVGNYNYGGPSDNASEGVGIGLDDGTSNCTVYGNSCTDNEGNGIQLYGGGSSATWTDTHNIIVANFFRNNCTAAFTNRRSGGTARNSFVGDIGIAYTYGANSLVANNTFGGTTPAGITVASTVNSLIVANNIMLAIAHPIVESRASGSIPALGYQNNDYQSATQIYNTASASTDGSLLYNLLSYSGTNDFTFDPQLDSNFRIATGSSAIHAGANLVSAYIDFEGKGFFPGSPSLGMIEFTSTAEAPGGQDRKAIYRSR